MSKGLGRTQRHILAELQRVGWISAYELAGLAGVTKPHQTPDDKNRLLSTRNAIRKLARDGLVETELRRMPSGQRQLHARLLPR